MHIDAIKIVIEAQFIDAVSSRTCIDNRFAAISDERQGSVCWINLVKPGCDVVARVENSPDIDESRKVVAGVSQQSKLTGGEIDNSKTRKRGFVFQHIRPHRR